MRELGFGDKEQAAPNKAPDTEGGLDRRSESLPPFTVPRSAFALCHTQALLLLLSLNPLNYGEVVTEPIPSFKSTRQ